MDTTSHTKRKPAPEAAMGCCAWGDISHYVKPAIFPISYASTAGMDITLYSEYWTPKEKNTRGLGCQVDPDSSVMTI